MYSTRAMLERAFDSVDVSVAQEKISDWCYGSWRDVEVYVRVRHRGDVYGHSIRLRPEMVADPDMYTRYLRTEMPRRIAHSFLDYFLQG